MLPPAFDMSDSPVQCGATVRLRVLRMGGLYRPGEHCRAVITSGDVRRVWARLSISGRGRSPEDKTACRVALRAKGEFRGPPAWLLDQGGTRRVPDFGLAGETAEGLSMGV